jgi:zinc protease
VRLIFTGAAPWSRERLHGISTLAQVLQIRLREILREELSATYGVGVSGSLSWRPQERYNLSIYFGCAPEEVDTLVATIFRVIDEVRREGVEAEYIDKVQEIQRRKRETDVKENSFWLRGLESYYTRDQDPRLLLAFDELIEGISSESLRLDAERYLDPENYVLGVLNPEASAEAPSGPTPE